MKFTYYYFNPGGYVFIGVKLFVCLLAGLCKNCLTDFHKIWWKVGTWPSKKPLDFVGNLDHVKVGLWLLSGWASAICVTGRSFNSDSFMTSAAWRRYALC